MDNFRGELESLQWLLKYMCVAFQCNSSILDAFFHVYCDEALFDYLVLARFFKHLAPTNFFDNELRDIQKYYPLLDEGEEGLSIFPTQCDTFKIQRTGDTYDPDYDSLWLSWCHQYSAGWRTCLVLKHDCPDLYNCRCTNSEHMYVSLSVYCNDRFIKLGSSPEQEGIEPGPAFGPEMVDFIYDHQSTFLFDVQRNPGLLRQQP